MDDKPTQKKLLVAEWLEYAEDDELNAQSILKHRDGTPRGACLMSHQMTEKHLKAFLIQRQGRFPRVHILEDLLTLCAKLDNSFETLKEDTIFLDQFYSPARYPADLPDFLWKDAEEAFAAATRIKEFVLEKLAMARRKPREKL